MGDSCGRFGGGSVCLQPMRVVEQVMVGQKECIIISYALHSVDYSGFLLGKGGTVGQLRVLVANG